MNAPKETAAMVYERIMRRRGGLAGPVVAGASPVAEDAGAQDRAAAGGQAGPAGAAVGRTGAPGTRAGAPSAAASTRPEPAGSPPLRVDELLFEEPAESAPRQPLLQPARAAEDRGPAEATGSGTFPRSATMRLVLKHPALVVGLGIPAAGVLLRYPASRRLLGAALRLGVRPEIQQLVKLSAAAAKRSTAPQVRSPQAGPPPPGSDASD